MKLRKSGQPASPEVKSLQIKTTERLPLQSSELAKIKYMIISSAGRGG